MDLRSGDIVYGEDKIMIFKIQKPIGRGAFGLVYKIENQKKESFALKTITTSWLDKRELKALINEGKLSVEIIHDNVLRKYYFHDGKVFPELPPYIIMDLAEGGTLKDLIDHHRADKKNFTNEELENFFLQLASGMKCINDNLVHRDIKPDNILIKDEKLKISDFGLSKLVGVATRDTTFKGINHFMYCSPEAWRLEKNTISMDIYSMGIVFYELATLNFPYSVKNSGDFIEAWKDVHMFEVPVDPQIYNRNLDLKVAQIIMKMISKKTHDRYKSWEEIIERLEGDASSDRPSFDVNGLVKKAMNKVKDSEKRRLAIKTKEKAKKEINQTVEYSFNEIENVCKSVVNDFNKKSEFIKLTLQRIHGTSLNIGLEGSGLSIEIFVIPVYDSGEMRGKVIKAWGYAKAPSGRGFNLILLLQDEDDLYGQWDTIHVYHNPLARRMDHRPEPFPFEIEELPRGIASLNALDVFQSKIENFRPILLESLVAELLE